MRGRASARAKANLDLFTKGGDYFFMNQNFGERQMFDATCSNCNQPTQVPFQPSGDRPVYCSNCFRQMRGERHESGGGGRGGDRPMYDATCSTCGKPTQVPFRPTEGRPVYCREHYQGPSRT